MLKKIITVFFSAVCCFLLCSACSDGGSIDSAVTVTDCDLYRIDKIDGQYYMYFKGEYDSDWESKYLAAPSFSSLSKLKSSLLAGELSEGMIRFVRYRQSEDGYMMRLPNLDCLYDLQLPNDLIITRANLMGNFYTFGFEDHFGIIDGAFYLIDEEDYDGLEEEFRVYLKYPENCTVTAVEKVEDRNATETYFYTSVCKLKQVVYEITTDQKTIEVYEEYILESDAAYHADIVSDESPSKVMFRGKQDGYYFCGIIFEMTDYGRPSEEWWSSIGLKEHRDTSWTCPIAICLSVILLLGGSLRVFSILRKKKTAVLASPEMICDTTISLEDA